MEMDTSAEKQQKDLSKGEPQDSSSLLLNGQSPPDLKMDKHNAEDTPENVKDVDESRADSTEVENGIDKSVQENKENDVKTVERTIETIAETNSEVKNEENGTENIEDKSASNTDITDPLKETQEKEEQEKEEDSEKDGWTYVLGHDKLKLKVLRKGEADTRPMHGQVVTVRCCGELEDGTKIDEKEELRFTVGDGDVIQAFDLCIALMQLHELSQIVTEAKYAYGKLGRKPDVPADASLTYEVELLKVEDAPDVTKLPIGEKIKLGDEKRERGNFWYTRGEYAAAINSYTKALRLLDESNIASEQESLAEFTEIRVKCFNNLAASQLKVEAWDAGIRSCDSVLKLQPTNCKAYFRKGKCYAAKGELEKAIASMREAIKYEPESKLIHQELSKLVKKNKSQKQSRQEMYQRMFGTGPPTPKKKAKKSSWWLGGSVMAATAVMALGAAIGYRYWQ